MVNRGVVDLGVYESDEVSFNYFVL